VRLLRPVLLTLGVGLLVALVVRNDPAAVLASLGRLSWRFVVILLFPVSLVSLFDALGWRYAFRRDRVPFVTLVRTRLVGEAFNLVTPTAALGGEVVKAWLLRDRVPLAQSVPSVIIAKTTITLAQGIFLLLGIVLATFQLGRSPLLLGMQWLLGLEVLALAIFIVVQGRGMVGWSARLPAPTWGSPRSAPAPPPPRSIGRCAISTFAPPAGWRSRSRSTSWRGCWARSRRT